MEGSKRCLGGAIAQVVSRRLPTSAARIRSQVKSCGIHGGQSGTAVGILRVLQFPLTIFIPPNASYSTVIWGFYGRPISDRCTKWTQSHPIKQNLKKKMSIGVYAHPPPPPPSSVLDPTETILDQI
jgi:hypothetical protein